MQSITISRAANNEYPIVHRLVQLYLHDFSEFEGQDGDADGLYPYDDLAEFWSDPRRAPFLVRYDGKLAGFALIQRGFFHEHQQVHDESLVDMVDFFVMRKYRRKGVGRSLARHCFDTVRGSWQVRTDEYNGGAFAFWQRVINEYTHGQYQAYRPQKYPGVMYYFNNELPPVNI